MLRNSMPHPMTTGFFFRLQATAALAVTTALVAGPLAAQTVFSSTGIVESTSGGFMFPDGSVQESAVASALTPIDSLPFTITTPGSYYLTQSMTIDSGVAITIDSSDVALDLMGHTLDGLGSASRGIEGRSATSNVEIRNGSVVGFVNNGLDASGGGYRISHIRAVDNLSANARGISATGLDGTITGCLARGNGNAGIYVGPNAVVRNNIVIGNFGGIAAATTPRATIAGNVVSDNTYFGIRCFGDCAIVDNVVHGNNVADSSATAGIFIQGDNSLIRGNHLTGNLQQNLLISGKGNVIEANTMTSSAIGVHFDANAGDNAAVNNRWSNHTDADLQNDGSGTITQLDNLSF